jgi:hypothetical protein
MLQIEYLLPLLTFWHTITTEVRKYKPDHSIANNIVSAIHCVSYIVQYNLYQDRNYTIHVSIGYYTYDLLYLLSALYWRKTTQIKQYIVFVFHHIFALYMLYIALTDDHREPLLYAFYIGDLSNITLYTSYHIRKEYPEYRNTHRFIEFIQLLWYSYFRVIRSTSLIFYDEMRLYNYSIVYQSSVFLIYIMGLVFSASLVKKNIVNFMVLSGRITEKSIVTSANY